jgi:hypothetical protein
VERGRKGGIREGREGRKEEFSILSNILKGNESAFIL